MDAREARGRRLTEAEKLDKISACKTIKETYDLVQHPDPWWCQVYSAPDFDSRTNENKTKTFDFCGHESTTDSARLQNWIKVCVGLVEFAFRADEEELRKWLQSHTHEDDELLSNASEMAEVDSDSEGGDGVEVEGYTAVSCRA
jgi:hypothetical protein